MHSGVLKLICLIICLVNVLWEWEKKESFFTSKMPKKRSCEAEVEGFFGTILHSVLKTAKSTATKIGAFLFASVYPSFITAFYNEKAVPFRREVFETINTIIPSDGEVGKIKILEIGIGPGYNLDYYPKQCRLIALDKNSHFKNVFIQNLRKHPGIVLENFLNECAEEMESVPSNSVDVVVSSHVHCSVTDSQQVLKEINRVLIPGGRYYFFEHVLDEPNTLRYKWQIFLNKIGLWKLIGHGCTFINFEKEISKSGFYEYTAKRYLFANTSWTYYPVYPVASSVGGFAVKEN